MWVIALEALVALALLLIIVWLTMGSARRRDDENDGTQTRDAERDRRSE